MHNPPSLARDTRRGANGLPVHPQDAAARGIQPGELCELWAQGKSLQVEVQISDEMSPGSVALPHGWGHEAAAGLSVASKVPGVNANRLAPDGAAALEPLSGMS